MDTDLILIRAGRRSRIKARVWAALVALGTGTTAELAEAANTTPARVHAVMLGDDARFARSSALVVLGVARPVRKGPESGYAITPAGATAWNALHARFGFTHAQITARWPSPDLHLTVR